MDHRNTERLAELFEQALTLPPADRRRYAGDACGDDTELCSELVSLLKAYEEAPDYLERVAGQVWPSGLTPTRSLWSGDAIDDRAHLRPGQRFGHYAIGRRLGRGGMSEVWEAEDLATGRRVALKMLGGRLQSAADRARFLREGRLAARVNHPNIVYVFGTEEIEGVPVIAMELARGGTLRDLVAAAGPLPPAQAVDVMLQAIAGLAAAGAAGVLHRDIKPSNCFVDEDGRIQVGDFGIAMAMAVSHEAAPTATGGVIGTPAFASPEQLRDQPLDVRSDIYAVGATLYYLLAGRPPFEDANVVRLIERVLHERPPGVRSVRPGVPRRLEKVILRCLARNPARRPQSYAELARQLAPYASASPAPAPLGLRSLAFLIDAFIVRFAGGAVPLLVLTQWQQRVLATPLEWIAFILAHIVFGVAYFGISEGVWSASPGKRITGLRVVAAGRQRPGIGRALARVSLWCLTVTPAVIVWLRLWRFEQGVGAWISGLPSYFVATGTAFAGVALLFSTARLANGFAGLHDLATRTRVVMKPAAEATSARPSQLAAPMLPSAPARLGPYAVLDETATPGTVVGFDEQLARRVWIRRAPPGTPAVPQARRSVRRPTRLRWLTGIRDADGAWDAYEAGAGEPLLTPGRQPADWATVRGWLQDLAHEITAAEEDGTGVPLTIDRVWVTSGRATLLDWPANGPEEANARPGLDVRDAQRFLHDVATLGLAVRPWADRSATPDGLPLHARALLDDLAAARFDTSAAIVERLRPLAARPVAITRARRCAHLAICGFAPMMGLLVFVPTVLLLLPRLAQSPDAFPLDACLRELGRLEGSLTAEAAQRRAAVETYLVGRFRPLLVQHSASGRPWFWPMIEARQSVVERALARHPNPSDEEIAHAAQQLAGLMSAAEGDRELAARGVLGWKLTLAAVLLLIAGTAAPAIVSAFFARGGAVLRLLGMAVVDREGREVSRSRALARALIAWTPGLAALLLLLPFGSLWSIEAAPLDQLAPSLLPLAVFVAGAMVALFNPRRGWQDRAARTALVAR